MAAIIFAIALMALLIYRKTWNVSMWLSSLSIGQYILYILLIYIALLVQSGIYRLNIPSNVPESAIEKMSIALVLIIIIVTLQTMVIIDQRNTMEESLELVNEQMESATEHYNEMIQKDQEVKKFRHDIKNLLLVLRTLIVDDKNEKALAYMDEMQESLSKTVKKYDTGNFMADAVLNSKDTKAAEYDTSLQFDGFVPVERVKDMDMVILLSNLLDNAIEACTKLPGHKEIRIDSILKKNTWVLIVQNPTMTDAIIENNSVQTTKENKNLHGFGLKNIERVATKYDGVMQIACENSIFKTRVTMNI
ncbi:MAG: ATP-binding protein [Lachnospiraceae bacterium]|nr:ATP-binding protein [Lachnospiraceae bacterium]